MSVHALHEGTFSVGLDRRFIPIATDAPPARGALKLSIHPFLILPPASGRVVLIDAGLGEFSEGGTPDTMRRNLAAFDLSDYEVTDILLSHLHYDHTGGLAHREHGYWELSFPDAAVWVNRRELEKVLAAERFYDEEKTEFLHFIVNKADIRPIDEGDGPIHGFRSRVIGGHTEFSVAWFYTEMENGQGFGGGKGEDVEDPARGSRTAPTTYLMAGDVIGSRGALIRKYAAKYDFDPDAGMRARESLKAEALQHGYRILAYHDSECAVMSLTGFDPKTGFEIRNHAECAIQAI